MSLLIATLGYTQSKSCGATRDNSNKPIDSKQLAQIKSVHDVRKYHGINWDVLCGRRPLPILGNGQNNPRPLKLCSKVDLRDYVQGLGEDTRFRIQRRGVASSR